MRKTFLKVALIGLLVGSLPVGFTSCKDYDDDIEQTNNQVADLKTKLASVETAIAALPSKADVTAAQAAAVAQAKADLEAVKAELQKAIDGKADKEAVEAINTELSKIQGQLETIDALKADVATALEAVTKVTTLEEKAQAQGQLIAGIQAQIGELTENGTTQFADITEQLTALKTAVNDPANGLDALKKQIAELADKIQGQGGEAASLEATLRVINGMVTSLRIVEDWGAANRNNLYGSANLNNGSVSVADRNTIALQLFNPVIVENTPVGPKGEALLFDMKKGDQKDFTDSLLVQVSPAGATLTQEQLTLVNSQLQEIKDFVVISNVRAFNKSGDILTSRAASSNGLYVVYFTQNPKYDWEDDAEKAEENETATNFAKATQANEGKGAKIRFAIALNETNEGGSRDVMTPYNIVVNGGTTSNTNYLSYSVDDTDVSYINNRWLYAGDNSSYMYVEKSVTKPQTHMTETYAAAGPIVSFDAAIEQGYAPVGDYYWKKDVPTLDKSDNRTADPYYQVEMGVPFTVSLNNISASKPVYGYYVTLDILRATESGLSEKTAWTKYAENIEGLDHVYSCYENIELTIKKAAEVPAGDVIGFRVWAVNYDGTLVDPDGRAFYVQVGEQGDVVTDPLGLQTFTATSTNIATVAPAWNIQTGINYADKLKDWTTAYTSVWVRFQMSNDTKKGLMAAANTAVTITFGDNTTLTSKAGANQAFAGSNWKHVYATDYAKVFNNMQVSINDVKFVDGNTYWGYIYVYSNEYMDRTLQIIPVAITKNVPTTLPTWFGVTAGLTDAAGNICIFTNSTLTNGAVTASFANVFRDTRGNGSYLSNTSDWSKFAFGIKIRDAQDATWNDNDVPAYYTNVVLGSQTNAPVFTFQGWKDENGLPVFAQNKNPRQLVFNDYNVNPQITDGIVYNAYVNGRQVKDATLPMVNASEAQNLTIWYEYTDVAYRRPTNVDTTNPSQGNAIGMGSKSFKVQTYPSTYVLNAPAMPTLAFNQAAALNADNITVSSSWTTVVKDMPLSTVSATATDPLYRIGAPVDPAKALITLTGDIQQYFTVEEIAVASTSTAKGALSCDEATGVVKIMYAEAVGTTPAKWAVVSGVKVKNNAAAGATTPKYGLDPTAVPAKVAVFIPVNGLTNAPATSVSGNLTINYIDALGLGAGYNYTTNKIIPYTKNYGITMKP